MTAAVARYATAADHDLLGDYIAFCRDLGVSDRALRDRCAPPAASWLCIRI